MLTMKTHAPLPLWSLIAPIAGWLLLALSLLGLQGGLWLVLMTAALIAGVLSAVHHAEVVAHRVGEPYGTLVLALAITVIEVALIVSLMLTGGPQTTALARDTVFAAVMLILNGIVGLCLLVGGSRYREQTFGLLGVSASLATLAAIAILTLVLQLHHQRSGAGLQPEPAGFCGRGIAGAVRHLCAGANRAPPDRKSVV